MADKAAALKVLGLSDSATDEEVRSAYKRLSQQWHPGGPGEHGSYSAMDPEEDEDYDSEDEYDSDEDYYTDSEGEEDYEPFSRGNMDFAGFMKLYGRMQTRGMMHGDDDDDDDDDEYGPGRGTKKAGEFCYCPECQRIRRVNKNQDREERRERARQWKLEREAEAAAERAKEEADKKLQETDPKNSLAWKRGGESRERLVREHFLKQTPSLVLHEASSSSLTLVLDVPDMSLLDSFKLPPKGVEWEVSYSRPGDKKWHNVLAGKEFDNVIVQKLTPGTEYSVRVRTGLAGNHTWSGSPDWGPWAPVHKLMTSGQPQQHTSGGKRGTAGKKKKNRDAAFAKLTRQQDEEEQQVEEEQQAEEEQHVEEEQGNSKPDTDADADADAETEADAEAASVDDGAEDAASAAGEDDGQLSDAASADGDSSSATAAAVKSELLPSRAGADKEIGDAAPAGAGDAVSEDLAEVPPNNAAAADDDDDDAEEEDDDDADADAVLAAAHAAAAEVEAAEAAGLPLPDFAQPHYPQPAVHRPKFAQVCVYFPLGKCTYGNNCKFKHVQPGKEGSSAPAAAAAGGSSPSPKKGGQQHETATAAGASAAGASSSPSPSDGAESAVKTAAKMEVGQLDALLSTFQGPPTLDKAKEVAELSQRIAARVPTARYQPAPVTPDGAYLKPLFLAAYNVVEDSYAAWYKGLQAGGKPRTRHQPAAVQEKLERAMADHHYHQSQQPSPEPQPGRQQQQQQSPSQQQQSPSQQQQQQQQRPLPAAAAAATSNPGGSSSSSNAAVHKPKYTSQCKWFPLGTCRFGDRCAFVHYVDNSADAPAAPAAAGGSSGGGSSTSTSSHHPPPPLPAAPQQQHQQLQMHAPSPVAASLPQSSFTMQQHQQPPPPYAAQSTAASYMQFPGAQQQQQLLMQYQQGYQQQGYQAAQPSYHEQQAFAQSYQPHLGYQPMLQQQQQPPPPVQQAYQYGVGMPYRPFG